MTQPSHSMLTGVVLAGGQSRRIGRNKALMELDGQSLIERILNILDPLCDELILSANDPTLYAGLGVRIVPDVLLNRGPLSGIHAGLAAMRAERALVVACDMPFLNPTLLRYLTVVAPDYDVVVPQVRGKFEPLHAVYGVACVKAIERMVAKGPRRIVHLYDHVSSFMVAEERLREFDPLLRSFTNVNTPQEWAQIQSMTI